MAVNLTANAIPAINAGDVNSKPVVQVLDIKLIGTTQERYRLTLSDSESTQQAMLATQLNDRVKTGRVRKTSVIQLIEYICSTVQNRKYSTDDYICFYVSFHIKLALLCVFYPCKTCFGFVVSALLEC